MISRYNVSLNGISLESIAPSILIHDVKYSEPNVNDTLMTIAKRNGARPIKRYFPSANVTVEFEIHAYDIRQRNDVCRAVVAWAKNGGTLEVNDRTDQFLKCVCSKFPSVESVRNWTDPLSITFTAYIIPFWQEKRLSSITLTGTSTTGTLYVPGNVDGALVEVQATANAALDSVTFGVNGIQLMLDNVSLASGSVINITYDDKAIQSIKVGTTSLLDKHLGADDLLAKCGENNTFSLTASASVTAIFKVRGWWL